MSFSVEKQKMNGRQRVDKRTELERAHVVLLPEHHSYCKYLQQSIQFSHDITGSTKHTTQSCDVPIISQSIIEYAEMLSMIDVRAHSTSGAPAPSVCPLRRTRCIFQCSFRRTAAYTSNIDINWSAIRRRITSHNVVHGREQRQFPPQRS